MSELVSKIDENRLSCIIHCRKNISSKINEFSEWTWNKVLNAAEIRGDELSCKGKHIYIYFKNSVLILAGVSCACVFEFFHLDWSLFTFLSSYVSSCHLDWLIIPLFFTGGVVLLC